MTIQFKTIVADPPWQYNNKNTGGSMNSGSANKYSTLSINEICNLVVNIDNNYIPIQELSEKNSVLFLWTTTPFLKESFTVLESWGYKHKTSIYWIKTGKLLLGHYFRGQVEIVHVCVKGKIKPFKQTKPNVIYEKPRGHSKKPEQFWTLIEPIIQQFDLNPKIELFSREIRAGWYGWGDEYPST